MISYTLIRSKRKTVALYVRNGGVEIRAPLKMPKYEIDKFVASKEKWITGKLAKSREQSARRENFMLDYGSLVIYLGKQYPIQATENNRTGFDGEQFYMPQGLTPEQIKTACIKVYRLLAKRYLTERTIEIARQMSVVPTAIKINDARTRWGSCSAKKNINFSWRLIQASDDVIDYVIVHELAHITEMNHSKRFWTVVENFYPNYTEQKRKLKELQQRLGGEDW